MKRTRATPAPIRSFSSPEEAIQALEQDTKWRAIEGDAPTITSCVVGKREIWLWLSTGQVATIGLTPDGTSTEFCVRSSGDAPVSLDPPDAALLEFAPGISAPRDPADLQQWLLGAPLTQVVESPPYVYLYRNRGQKLVELYPVRLIEAGEDELCWSESE